MSCCLILPLAEDNARFLLLGLVLLVYMLAGALLFQQLEQEQELKQSADFWALYQDFRDRFVQEAGEGAVEDLHRLLYAYGNATISGIIYKRRRWDFSGSFHFVGTIVSTIGYGNTTPQTTLGKSAAILYGLFGCSGGILFFNLFLERIITFLAWVLRSIHLRRIRKRSKDIPMTEGRRISKISRSSLPDILDDDEESSLEHWKPSVYWVMLSLTLASIIVALGAAAVYSEMENWTYFEALYFCFISFATIGFGDFVPLEKAGYPYVYLYRFGNCAFLILGCCCIYSLLNVTSIVIKQGLNWLIVKLQCRCTEDPMSATGRFWRRHSVMFQSTKRTRRRSTSAGIPPNVRRPGIISVWKRPPNGPIKKEGDGDSDSIGYDSDGERGTTGELISMKDFLKANKVSLAVMQKQLYETAQMQRESSGAVYHVGGGIHVIPKKKLLSQGFVPGSVGPLAIVTEKLGETNKR